VVPENPVHGEFLRMLRLAFGITHDNGSASDSVSAQRLWIPKSRSVFVPSVPNEFDVVVVVSEIQQLRFQIGGGPEQ
jgi:hypothetical protein